jgi:pyrimidine operon attenuation protein/uracil phosphoribosyltransferase
MSGSVSPEYIMHSAHLQRSLNRMAMQISEDLKNEKSVAILGINTRGFHVAQCISQLLNRALNVDVPCYPLAVKSDQQSISEEIFQNLKNTKYILLVDDVLFSGSTMIKALRSILNIIEPPTIRVAVVIDRGHRRFPIQPDFVGLVSPTKFKEHVELVFDEENNPKSVILTER